MSKRTKQILKLTGTGIALVVFVFFVVAFRPLPKRTTIVEKDGYRLTTTHERRYEMLPVGNWDFGSRGLNGCGPTCSTTISSFGFVSFEDVTTHCSERL